MNLPLLSINIVSYNTKDVTLRCLRSIEKSTSVQWITQNPAHDIEIVIIDNASKDGSADAIEALSKELTIPIRLIRNTENVGFGKGHNKAARESNGEFLFLLNTDTLIQSNGLATLTKHYLESNPPSNIEYQNIIKPAWDVYRKHFMGPALLNKDFTAQPSCGPYYSIPVIFGALFLRGDHWGLTRYSPHSERSVDWISGAAVMCKKEYFIDVGGFDEEIFMYMEEIELFKRARQKGMKVWFYPEAQIVHFGSASSDKSYPIFQVYRGFLYLYTKHHKALELHVVQWMLSLKAKIAVMLGNVLKKERLVRTYEQALQIVADSQRIH